MTALAAILPVVSRSSRLALDLYRLGGSGLHGTKTFNITARSISSLALILKQVGTIIKEDDRLPSAEALETLEDIVDQSTAVLNEIESILSQSQQDLERSQTRNGNLLGQHQSPPSSTMVVARLEYLVAHLDSLKSTLSVMLQTLYTAQSIMWARVRPTVSPQQGSRAVANEKNQLEILIIEQQMSILSASNLYEPSRPDARLLMETDSSQSLVAVDHVLPKPGDLFRYQDKYIASLDASGSYEDQWLNAVCGVSKSQLERLLERWTRLPQLEEELRNAERQAESRRRETLQPSVESDSDEEAFSMPRYAGDGVKLSTPTPRRPGSVQPLFTETATLPIPVPESKYGPKPPLSPASSLGMSPRSSGINLSIPTQPGSNNVSPRSSITTLPVEAAAAVEAKDKDDEVDLEIPWTLRTRRDFWSYIDGKVQDSNTDAPTSAAFADNHSWTEIMASWVCKEAIREAGYKFTQVQKEKRDGRRTKFETCFCIEQPLTFDQVHRLVERTVDIYRRTQPPSPPPREDPRRSSFERRPSANAPIPSLRDRDRTPLAKQPQHPPLERSVTGIPPPPAHPPLDRSVSMPGPLPTYPPNPRTTNPHLPLSPVGSPHTASAYLQHPPTYSPQPHAHPYQATAPYSPQVPFFSSPQSMHPPNPGPFGSNPAFNAHVPPPHAPPPHDPRLLQLSGYPQSPLRQSQSHSRSGSYHDHYSSASTTSDSDSAARARKHRSRSRRRSETPKKKAHEHSGATKALMGVAGLTALLDGLVGI